ncbi:MAG: 4Fe-4S dicluster domain-containing protein [Dehalococcoidia bacterium]|nr:MAG: 4Fe-4S dicluster domain-containing protein [Dehalococcoidia bacterium]
MSDKQGTAKPVKGSIVITSELCKGCELCIHFCPKTVISQSTRLNAAGYQSAVFSDNGECTGCAVCALVCPEVAIEVFRG